VLKLIAMAVNAARAKNKPINMCGQMSGNPTYVPLLLGMGLRQISVSPAAMPEIKKVIRGVTLPQCEAIARRALSLENARDIRSFLKEELKKVAPQFTA
jgi:phosphotransferase system enzyme I (PtsI)